MSFVPFYIKRNRSWGSPVGSNPGVRYQAPCTGVEDDGNQFSYDCSSDGTGPDVETDLCGKPFRPGANLNEPLASSSPDPKCGRPPRSVTNCPTCKCTR